MTRIALALMLFEFLSPAFMPLIVLEIPAERTTVYQTQHHSIVLPAFLTEKEEKEDCDTQKDKTAAIIDFICHNLNLAATHGNKYSKFAKERLFIRVTGFELFCILLI
jgi:hypothetical protein